MDDDLDLAYPFFARAFGSLSLPSQGFINQGNDMTVIKTSLFSVLEKFPDHKKAIGSLYRESESFQTLCEDYQSCAAALRHWEKSDSEQAAFRREEYSALMQDLKKEIMQFLNESK